MKRLATPVAGLRRGSGTYCSLNQTYDEEEDEGGQAEGRSLGDFKSPEKGANEGKSMKEKPRHQLIENVINSGKPQLGREREQPLYQSSMSHSI